MQNQQKKFEEEYIETFISLFYPHYPSLSSPEDFLAYYDPLFQELRKFDEMDEKELKKFKIPLKYFENLTSESIEENQTAVFLIIEQLNNLCTYCHRKQLRIKISQEVQKYSKNLKNLAIGKKPTRISLWQQKFYSEPLSSQFQQSKKKEILEILDKLYVQQSRIPNYYLLFLSNPETFIAIYKFQSQIILDLKSDKTSMPIEHKFYLGVIAASTYGSRYLWNLMVCQFIHAGGDANWIQYGIQYAPPDIKKFAQVSYQMAYNFKTNSLQTISAKLGLIIEDLKILQGFYILSYYQFLACISLVFGLISQNLEFQKFLPETPFLQPSLESFETMKKVSKKQMAYEMQMAKQFQEMYSWQTNSEKNLFKRVQIEQTIANNQSPRSRSINEKESKKSSKKFQDSVKKKSKSNPKLSKTSSENELLVTLEQQEMTQKIKQSRTMHRIESVYGHYVPFESRFSNIEDYPRPKNMTQKSVKDDDNSSTDILEDKGFVYASDWTFSQHAGILIETVFDTSLHLNINSVLKSLHFITKEKSKNLKVYYQSLQNYIYEYVSYVSLINESLTPVQKNYVKLLTRSPFLFNERAFTKMKDDISTEGYGLKGKSSLLLFCLQIFSFKLELSLSLSSYVYDRFLQNQD